MPRELSRSALIERSIIKTYHKQLWTPFINALKQYALISPGDKIAVCISGGKDSMLLAKLMQQLHRHSDVPFALEYLVMDPGYAPANRAKIEENAEILGVPVTIFASDIFAVANGAEKNPCYLCARMRRGALYAKAQELGCNKIALGHHRDDVIETTVMAMFYGAQLQGMMPKLHSTNFPGMELIRPLYCVREEDIIAWAKHNELSFLQCACRFTERTATAGHETESKRKEVKALIRTLRETNPDLESNIFHAIHAVNLDMFPGWKTKGEKHSFLETY
ncbi:MAG: tRNA 2-thiocytidine biosynthesis protein TtcA [Oscillospiraceae bacterium]|nr:tRNA 2-thiocytidine biosynthesis protein TtcA [Oscillospiraceae bacterium]